MITTSSDGQTFQKPTVWQDSAGVPSLIQWKGDTLIAAFQWFRQPKPSPTWDRVAVKFSYDNGQTWTEPIPIVIPDMPAGYQRPFDPTLVPLGTDSVRIYFSSSAMPPMGLDATVNTYSATTADGIHYSFDPGIRVDHPTKPVIDPAVIRFKNLWHYTAPAGAPQDGAHHHTSIDGLNFTEQMTLPSDNTHNWTGNLMLESQNLLRFYGAGAGIWYSESTNGATWGPYQMTNIQGGDPTVLKRSENEYVMIYVGPPGTTAITQPAIWEESLRVTWNNPLQEISIEYDLNQISNVRIYAYDLLGRTIAQEYKAGQHSGHHQSSLQINSASTEIILVSISAGNELVTRKIFLPK